MTHYSDNSSNEGLKLAFPNDTLRKHADAVSRLGEVTASNVRGIRTAINKAERGSAGFSVPKYADSADWRGQVWELEGRVGECRPKVVGELHDTGVAVLTNPRYKSRLSAYAEDIAELDHFRLDHFARIGSRGLTATPVYSVHNKAGERLFRFMHIPWQSGGDGPEIVY